MESTAAALNPSEGEREELRIDIPADLNPLISEPALWPELCIYRVPRKLREINAAAYTPQLISIGPFHCKDKALWPMQQQKLRYLAEFCKRTGINWTELEDQIKHDEVKIPRCYEEFGDICSDKFVKMILLDSVFIIELFLRRKEKEDEEQEIFEDDFILGKPTREFSVLRDLILVENQLPYFVLEELYQFSISNSNGEGYLSFFDLVKFNLQEYLPCPKNKENKKLYSFWNTRGFCCQRNNDKSSGDVDEEEEEEYLKKKPLHFTDLLRKHRSFRHPKSKNFEYVKKLYNAIMLHEAGVKFKASPDAWPIDIKFERGELKMPIFLADDHTECIIRNLMAFEQCHYPNRALICEYILILDFLINTEKDVDLLVQKGVIENLLGDNDSVAKLVNKLALEITVSGSCFYNLSEELNKHYENPLCRTVAILRSVYFNNLWRGTATVAAIILLLCTFTQTVYSII